MSVIVATKEEVQEYYLSEALGQSKLKRLLGDISSFQKEEDSSAEHFVIGSAVDCLLTSTPEDFEQSYHISKVEKLPSDAVIKILGHVYEDLLSDYAEHLEVVTGQENPAPVTSFFEFVGELNTWETYILDACLKEDWNRNWGAAAKLKNILEPGAEYFKELCLAKGKRILSTDQASTVDNIVAFLKSNPRTSRYFDRDNFMQLPHVTIHYQFAMYFEYRGVQCKALLDMVVVERDADGRIVSITPIDLKTMNGNTFYFPSSVRARRYDIQAAWYTLALHHHFAIPEGSDIIKPFLFVVESTSYQGKPLVFQADSTLLQIGRYGRKAVSLVDTNLFTQDAQNAVLAWEIKGFEQLLDLYLYHIENGFREEREVQEAGLTPLVINWDGII